MSTPDLNDRIAALSPGRRAQLLHRLRGTPQAAGVADRFPHPRTWANAQVRLGRPGHLDNLRFEPLQTDPPGPGQIQIRAHAIGINFRDLMIALGLYPPTPSVPSLMGSDYAGEVIACGPGAEELAVGDRVMALSVGHTEPGGGLRGEAHFCAAPAIWSFQAVRIPASLSFVEAASVPTAFLTALYGLHHVARLAPGERVLIHSATGGVGLAAVEIARWLGAEVVATAGSEAKRDYLRRIGISTVHDSRSTAFADEIRGGVDVVFNTLSAEAVTRGLDLLRPFGRFLQIDKHDIATSGSLPLSAFRNGLSFTAIDLSLFLQRPQVITTLFGELADHLAARRLKPTPIRAFPPERLGDALKLMSRYQHIGKLVIDLEASA